MWAIVCALALAADPTPAERFQALVKEYEAAEAAFQKSWRDAPADQKDAVAKARPAAAQVDTYVDRVLRVATDHPKDFTAVYAARWLMKNWGWSEKAREAAEIAAREHATDPRMADLCRDFFHHCPSNGQALLRAAADRSPHREVRGLARYALGKAVKADGERRAAAGHEAGAVRKLEEAADLFRQVADKYADLKGQVEPLGVEAGKLLFELEHLSVGKVAPDLTGTDLDGKPFKLGDYRGQVVLVHFWGSWCGFCLAEAPHFQKLLRLHAGRPFAVVGVASDKTPAVSKAAGDKAGLPGRSLFDGDGGPVVSRWNVRSWPTLYLLDAKGVIRYKGDVLRTTSVRKNSGGELEQFWYLDDYVAALLKEQTDPPKPE
jgi:thiol-disulfide isomerase/thioredoxin